MPAHSSGAATSSSTSAGMRTTKSLCLTDLVGELSTRSDLFRTLWAKHNVRFHDTGAKRLHHPIVGQLHPTYENMRLTADTGLTLFA
jgi:hypothetical protein